MNWPWSKPKGAHRCERFGITCNHDCDKCEQLKEFEAIQAKYKQEPECAYPQFANLQALRMIPRGYIIQYVDSTPAKRYFLALEPIEITLKLMCQLRSGGKVDGLKELPLVKTQTQGIPQVFLDMDK